MRQRLVLGNWKQNGSFSKNEALLCVLRDRFQPRQGCTLGVCVPLVYLAQTGDLLSGSEIAFGAQNCSATQNGAFTGEVGVEMLREFHSSLVLVGHSERRALYLESDSSVGLKAAQVIAASLTPVVCVGETLAERDAGLTFSVVDRQLNAVVRVLEEQKLPLSKIVLAYEPVWAIGTGKTATNEQAQVVHAHLRNELQKWGAADVSILYGGSVKPSNAKGLFSQPDIDGGLIGGASLVAEDFLAIYDAL
jgi:triosephosphate isomerase (TIM)